jgi:PAS domain S-box-containing protein
MPDRMADPATIPALPTSIALLDWRRAGNDAPDDLIWVVDAAIRMVECCDASRVILARMGIPAEMTFGFSAVKSPLLRDGERDAWERLYRHVLETGERVSAEADLFLMPGAAPVRWEIRLRARRDAEGAITGVRCVARDMTRRVRAEARLREIEARHELLLGATEDGIFDVDLATGNIWHSPRALELVGVDDPATYHHIEHLQAIVHPDDREAADAAFAEHLAHGTPYRTEIRIRRRDGAWRWIETQGKAARDADGRPVRMVGSNRDVTARREAEQALHVAHDRLEQAFQMARVGAWTFTPATNAIWWSDGTFRLFGRDPALGPPDYATYLGYVHPDDRDALVAAVGAALAGGERYAIEHRAVREDGTVLTFSAMGLVTRTPDGSVQSLAGTVLDITPHKATEHALRDAKEAAEASSRAKSDFLASMSHELRTPLNAVIGFAQRLERLPVGTPLGDKDRLFVERIASNGRHLLALIDDILDIARIEAGRMDVEFAPTDIGTLCAEVVTQLEAAPRAAGVALLLEVPDDLAPVRSDSRRLRQVLVNLVGNALKFTAEGSVRVRVVADPATHRPSAIEVVDTGIGIPADRLGHIFGKFEQAERGTQRRFGGTGLGLAISRALCEMMGHDLGVRSTEGVGSTFSVGFASQLA